MLIQEVIDLAKNSELTNLNVRDDDAAIIGFINLGMTALYDRFNLSTEEFIFERTLLTNFYDVPVDCLRLVSAYGTIIRYDKPELSELPINVEDNPYSINLVSYKQLQTSNGIAEGQVSVVYVNAPTAYTTANLTDVIGLPPQMIEPLLHYVGYRAHAAIDSSAQDENNVYYQRYDKRCLELERRGSYTSDDVNMEDRLRSRGFA